jgi:hypothetical protein
MGMSPSEFLQLLSTLHPSVAVTLVVFLGLTTLSRRAVRASRANDGTGHHHQLDGAGGNL